MHKNFGQAAGVALASVVGSLINVGSNVWTAIKADALAQEFQKKIENIDSAKEYTMYIASKVFSSGRKIIDLGQARPGTATFERLLQKELSPYMIYKGLCNADIYFPTNQGALGTKKLFGSFTREGGVSMAYPETGPVWAAKCKNALDDLDVYYISGQKDRAKFERAEEVMVGTGGLSLAAKFGGGVLILALLMMALTTQRRVVSKLQAKAES